MFVAPGYAWSFHDGRVLRDTDIARNWLQYFSTDPHSAHPTESYLLGDPGHLGMDHFIFRRMGKREMPNFGTDPVLRAFNRLHAGFRVAAVE